MMACCSLCYGQYLNADGSVDEAALAAVRAEREQHAVKQGWSADQIAQIRTELCRCACHVQGSAILH